MQRPNMDLTSSESSFSLVWYVLSVAHSCPALAVTTAECPDTAVAAAMSVHIRTMLRSATC